MGNRPAAGENTQGGQGMGVGSRSVYPESRVCLGKSGAFSPEETPRKDPNRFQSQTPPAPHACSHTHTHTPTIPSPLMPLPSKCKYLQEVYTYCSFSNIVIFNVCSFIRELGSSLLPHTPHAFKAKNKAGIGKIQGK